MAPEPVSFTTATPDSHESLGLLADYERELVHLGVSLDHGWAGGLTPGQLVPPRGAWLLGRAGKDAVACGGVRLLSPEVAEIKRMYVAPAARGQGVAMALLTRLEAAAAVLGARVVRLDTGPGMEVAVALYRRAGYAEIADYNGNPDAGWWFEKPIEP